MSRFLFRIDVSPSTGVGHLKRCLSLGRELADLGGDIYFLCRADGFDVSRYMAPMVREWRPMEWSTEPGDDAGEVVRMYGSKKIDTAIIDHYRADEEYQRVLYGSGIRWLQFDGTARYPIWSDWVLNMSPDASRSLYDNLLRKENTLLLLGPTYAVLRKEFEGRRALSDKTEVRRILLTFGGGDDRGATIFCLKAIEGLDDNVERIVLMSSTNPQKGKILEWCEGHANTRVLIDTNEMASHMASADLGITAGGTTVFEMATLGVPILILQIADNQVPISGAWERRGYGVNVGPLDYLRQEVMLQETISLMEDESRRRAMSDIGRTLVDGRGTRRVVEALLAS